MDLFIFTKEILSGKLQFFCSDIYTEKKDQFQFSVAQRQWHYIPINFGMMTMF